MLQEFQFVVKYRNGSAMEHVDVLSRSPVLPPSDIEKDIIQQYDIFMLDAEDEVITIQNADPSLGNIRKILEVNNEERTFQQRNEIKDFQLTKRMRK